MVYLCFFRSMPPSVRYAALLSVIAQCVFISKQVFYSRPRAPEIVFKFYLTDHLTLDGGILVYNGRSAPSKALDSTWQETRDG